MLLPKSILGLAAFAWILLVQFTTGIAMRTQPRGGTPYRKFGCGFENNMYALSTPSIFDIRYGREIIPMDIESIQQFNGIIQRIESINAELLEQLVYNNAGYLVDFYRAFKGSRTSYRDFRSFYTMYTPSFRPNEVCSSMAVQLLDRIATALPALPIASHSYLSTCSPNVDKSVLESLGISTDESDKENDSKEPAKKKLKTKDTRSTMRQEPPRSFIHGHVAGFIRIRLERTRLGYIFLDPGYGIQRPVVIMEDGKSPRIVDVVGTSRASQGEDFKFSLPSTNLDYILATSRDDDDSIHEHHLFYVGRPFCSFLQSTTKPSIITPFKNMVRRRKSGFPIAAMYFDISKTSPKFTFALYDDFKGPKKRYVDFGGRGNLPRETQAHYSTVLGYLDTYSQNLTTEIMQTMEEIAKDKVFIKNMELSRIMDMGMKRGIRIG